MSKTIIRRVGRAVVHLGSEMARSVAVGGDGYRNIAAGVHLPSHSLSVTNRRWFYHCHDDEGNTSLFASSLNKGRSKLADFCNGFEGNDKNALEVTNEPGNEHLIARYFIL